METHLILWSSGSGCQVDLRDQVICYVGEQSAPGCPYQRQEMEASMPSKVLQPIGVVAARMQGSCVSPVPWWEVQQGAVNVALAHANALSRSSIRFR